MIAKADVVVIAQAVSNRDTTIFDPQDGWGLRMGVKTRFDNLTVLKGKVKGDSLVVFHFRFAGPPHDINGPSLVKFKPRGSKDHPATDYLLFLKRSPNGEFEPVTGQVDPVYSVRKVTSLTDDDQYQYPAGGEK
ncbi:MAG TPA: hypothetical protein VN541_23160 [Tepidisphaeraceae bacterium]|nr:hypothetical protein [Tepidisphaeraceae bacterium]